MLKIPNSTRHGSTKIARLSHTAVTLKSPFWWLQFMNSYLALPTPSRSRISTSCSCVIASNGMMIRTFSSNAHSPFVVTVKHSGFVIATFANDTSGSSV